MVIHNAFAPGSVYRLSPAPQTRGWPFIKLHLSVDRQCKQCPLGVLLCHCLDPISCESSRCFQRHRAQPTHASQSRQPPSSSVPPYPLICRELPGVHSSQPSQGVERRCQVCEMCASRISHKSQSSSLCHRIHGSQGDAWLRRARRCSRESRVWERAARFNAD